MNRWFPQQIPRVHIDDEVFEKSLFLSRKQSIVSSKVSTIEAVHLALKVLGESESALYPFIPALKLSVDVVFKTRGVKPVFGNVVNPEYSQGDEKVFCPSTTVRPSCCPNCPGDEKRFLNLGLTSFYRSSMSGTGLNFFPLSREDTKCVDINLLETENKKLRKWQCKECKFVFLLENEYKNVSHVGVKDKL